ncbi:cytochrome c oxidase accessory protein CcoG [Collimonas sp. H4R21]|uniref:Cytochrome c oxidase accessory protein CcoG n=1 Tax=Collimonas rhizosphaerae TaxID=3126357 RepID=A0ABU9Q177_9BURK
MSTRDSSPKTAVVRMYQARQQIYPRDVGGRYATLRWLCVWLTQLVFYGMPWLRWNGRQAVLFDLAARKFYLFGVVLWPQDFIYLAVLLIVCAFSLFLFTAIAGRVWCGYACPQTVYTKIFLWIESRIEGPRSARMRLDRQGWSPDKLLRKSGKHLAWVAVALWTGFTFVGYFTPVRDLAREASVLSLGSWEWFWVMFYGFATYGNAGWMREQVCKYMCPYARFQSAMFDRDSLIVTYDAARGEPRTSRYRKTPEPASSPCIDCSMCVQVCPTGIDIRAGLQYMCIGCAACVDACNMVMDRIGAQRGLIRYSTEHAMAENLPAAAILRRVFRPRVLIYSSALLVIAAIFLGSLILRVPLKIDVIRDRGSMGREVEEGMVENVYRLQAINTDELPHRYKISVTGIDGIALSGDSEVTLAATETRLVPVRVRVPHGQGRPGSNSISFRLQGLDGARSQVNEKAVFYIPG